MPEITVQTFAVTLAPTDHTIDTTITAVGGWDSGGGFSANAFVLITGTAGYTGAHHTGTNSYGNAGDGWCHAYLTSSTNVRVIRNLGGALTGGNQMLVKGVVVEYTGSASGPNEFIVRDAGVVGTGTISTNTVHSVNPDTNGSAISTLADVTAIATANVDDGESAHADDAFWVPTQFNDGGTLKVKFTRTAGGGNTELGYHIVEWTGSNWTVTEESFTTGAAGASGVTQEHTLATTLGVLADCFHFCHWRGDAAANGVDDMSLMHWLSSTSILKTRYFSSTTRTIDFTAHIVENSQVAVERDDTVDGGLAALTNTSTETFTIGSVTTTEAIPLLTEYDESTGLNWPRMIHGQITAATTLTTYRTPTTWSSEGWGYEIVDFSGLTGAAATSLAYRRPPMQTLITR